jgi:hypothetical protein
MMSLPSMPLVDSQGFVMSSSNCNGIQQRIFLRRVEICLGRQKEHYDYSATPSTTTQPFACSNNLLFDTISTKILVTIHSECSKLNSVAFSPQANYTDRATAACRRSILNVHIFKISSLYTLNKDCTFASGFSKNLSTVSAK